MKTEVLLNELIEFVTQHREFAQQLQQRTDAELNYRQHPASWNVLECLEHLNLYGNFYLPEIEKVFMPVRLNQTKSLKVDGWGIILLKACCPK